MAEIKNYTMNFSYDRPADLTCFRKLVSTEIHCERALYRKRGS
jgi:hypothetical protein